MGGTSFSRSASLPRDDGTSIVELLLVLSIVGVLVGLSMPATAHSIDAGRARDASGFVAARLRLARQHAVFRTAAVALVFDQVGSRWHIRVCQDGNGTGVRRAEISDGIDVCTDGPYDLENMFPGVVIAVDGAIRGPDGEPGSADPVRFGSSDMVSFSPEGTATAGSLYLRSARGQQFVVRVGNITGRTRTLKYDPDSRTWRSF
jgi:type II secretory pathway pseudopilin PulG